MSEGGIHQRAQRRLEKALSHHTVVIENFKSTGALSNAISVQSTDAIATLRVAQLVVPEDNERDAGEG